jgi:hypothetical protein
VGSIDTITWQALTLVLTLAGLVSTGLVWKSRGATSGLRMLAVALLPAAAYLTGTLRLLWEIGDAILTWATRLAFSPTVWLGVMLAGISLALFLTAGMLRRRGIGTAAPAAGKPSAAGGKALPSDTSRRPAKAPEQDDDMADIEAILKRHGIS